MRTNVWTKRTVWGGLLAVVLLGVLVMVAACGGESEASAELTLGETIFVEGTDAQGTQIARTTDAGILSQTGCYACHGADGKGRAIDTKLGHFDVPDIRWSVIGQPFPNDEGGMDPAYDPATFAKAVREGLDSGGGELEPVMPHWQLTDPEMSALLAYLQSL
jgi:mono/diheme cytochrome c family protein